MKKFFEQLKTLWKKITAKGFIYFFNRYHYYIVFALLSILALVVRIDCIDFVSGDVNNFVRPWLNYFKDNGGLAALKEYPNLGKYHADYPMGYINLLALLSYLPVQSLYIIKCISYFFDFVLAIGVFMVIRHFTKNKLTQLLGYGIVLFYPTVILNSAFWGQCDQLYVSLAVWSLYFILKDKGNIAMIFIGLALSVKIQAIFFVPFILYLWLRKKIKFRSLWIIPLTIFATFLPSYIAGAPFKMPFEMFISLAKSYSNPNYGSPSMYAFLFTSHQVADIAIALALVGIIMLILYRVRLQMKHENILYTCALFAVFTPFVLPHMHDRYFFMADIMILLYVICAKPKKWYFAMMMECASFLCYTNFLFGNYNFKFFENDKESCIKIAAVIVLILIGLLLTEIRNLDRNEVDQAQISLSNE